MDINDLTLTEQFTILMTTGNNFKKTNNNYKKYLIASIIIDLDIYNMIYLNENKQIIITKYELSGIKFLDLILELINSKNFISINNVVEYFYSHPQFSKNVYNSILNRIVKKEVQYIKENNNLKNYPINNSNSFENIKDLIVNKMKLELLENNNLDKNTIYLIILLNESNIIKHYFSKYEYKQIENKIKKIYQKEEINNFKMIKKSIKRIERFSILNIIGDIISGLI